MSQAAELASPIAIGGAQIEVVFDSAQYPVRRPELTRWIAESACAVTEYYGRFPVPKLRVQLDEASGGRGVLGGHTYVPDTLPITQIAVGKYATVSELHDDWVMTHEMVHLALPSVDREHHWLEEGIATYVEPIARVQAGNLNAEGVWRDMAAGMPHGLAESGDEGLDRTHTWGRTYWGGALFCLLADVEIHRRTENHKGLQDALRAIVEAGGNMNVDWPIERVLQTGDRGAGVPVLTELYAKMKASPWNPDLDRLWRDLGVEIDRDTVTLHPAAPMASTARAIMTPHSARPGGCP